MFHAKWLPGEAESRQPKNIVQALERLFLTNENSLIIRLIGVIAYRVKRSGQASEAVRFAHEIRLMLRTERHCHRQSGTNTPFILGVNPQVIPGGRVLRAGLKTLKQLTEVTRRIRIFASLHKRGLG